MTRRVPFRPIQNYRRFIPATWEHFNSIRNNVSASTKHTRALVRLHRFHVESDAASWGRAPSMAVYDHHRRGHRLGKQLFTLQTLVQPKCVFSDHWLKRNRSVVGERPSNRRRLNDVAPPLLRYERISWPWITLTNDVHPLSLQKVHRKRFYGVRKERGSSFRGLNVKVGKRWNLVNKGYDTLIKQPFAKRTTLRKFGESTAGRSHKCVFQELWQMTCHPAS